MWTTSPTSYHHQTQMLTEQHRRQLHQNYVHTEQYYTDSTMQYVYIIMIARTLQFSEVDLATALAIPCMQVSQLHQTLKLQHYQRLPASSVNTHFRKSISTYVSSLAPPAPTFRGGRRETSTYRTPLAIN